MEKDPKIPGIIVIIKLYKTHTIIKLFQNCKCQSTIVRKDNRVSFFIRTKRPKTTMYTGFVWLEGKK